LIKTITGRIQKPPTKLTEYFIQAKYNLKKPLKRELLCLPQRGLDGKLGKEHRILSWTVVKKPEAFRINPNTSGY
jgi:hypothetical protein